MRATQQGHLVTVLTAMPNYPKGKIYHGYSGFFRREQIDGVQIIRTCIYPTQKTDFIRRLTNYFSFVFSSAIFGSFSIRQVDYLLTESPPLFLGLAGFILSRINGSRWIFNVSDLWPKTAVMLGVIERGGFASRLSAWLEAFCYQQAWLVSGQSKSIIEDISHRFPQCKTFHFSNGVDTNKFGTHHETGSTRRHVKLIDEFTIIYAGLHGIAQGLDQIIELAAQLEDYGNIRFVLIGDGPEKKKLIKLAERRNTSSVTFLDPCPKDEIPAFLASANAVLVPLKKYIPGAVPSKLYEAMASERPIILVAEGEAADIVNKTKSGIVIKPGDIMGIKNAILEIYNNPELRCRLGKNGREAAERDFDRTRIVDRFLDYLEAHI